jgi:hypothetical protein
MVFRKRSFPKFSISAAIRLFLLFVFLLPITVRTIIFSTGDYPRDWRSARWTSTGLLPAANDDSEARVLVFAAPNGSWRSIFAVHTWIVVKPAHAQSYTRYDVIGFGSPIRINGYPPDAYWFSAKPTVIGDVHGPTAAVAIPKIEAAVKNYAYAKDGDYRLWPGPNSNTFVATILRDVPELQVAMPPTAIGKDFRADYSLAGWTPSQTGVEIELFGLLGVKAAWVEGFEINFLSLVAGFDFRNPALKLPGFGRIGFDDIANLETLAAPTNR